MKITLNLSDISEDALFAGIADHLKESGPVFRQPEREEPFTAKEAAQALNVGKSTIYEMIDDGELPTVPGMTTKRIPACAIKAMQKGEEVSK